MIPAYRCEDDPDPCNKANCQPCTISAACASGRCVNSVCVAASYGTACSSLPNNCLARNSGTLLCDGASCSAGPPANCATNKCSGTTCCAANFNNFCTSLGNNCGLTNSGLYNCSGVCGASTPANCLTGKCSGTTCCAANFNSPCTSLGNNCGLTNSGLYNCSGICSALPPPNCLTGKCSGTTCCAANFNNSCTSLGNNCGLTNSGFYNCSGICSAVPPPNCPTGKCSGTTCCAANFGLSCPGNACGPGTNDCSGTCILPFCCTSCCANKCCSGGVCNPGFCNQSGFNASTFISQSGIPATMTAGQTATVSITMQNSGTNTWSEADLYRLGSQNPQDNLTWGVGRAPLPAGLTVAPGQQFTFTFTITAPAVAGIYNLQWQMVWEGIAGCRGGGWFGPFTPNVPINVIVLPPLDAQFMSQSVPGCIGPGNSAVVSVTMKNMGLVTWKDTSIPPFSLSMKAAAGTPACPWAPPAVFQDIPLSPGDAIASSATKTFSFTITAPATPGPQLFEYRMVQNNVGFGQFTNPTTVSVDPLCAPKSTISFLPPILNFQGAQGGANPGTQSFKVTNSGLTGSRLRWVVTADQPWLTNPAPSPLNYAAGVDPLGLKPGASDNVTVAVNTTVPAVLAAGNYSGSLTFNDPMASNNGAQVTVKLAISVPAPKISLSSTGLNFIIQEGRPSPIQPLTISNIGDPASTLIWLATTDVPQQTWLTLTPLSPLLNAMSGNPLGLAGGSPGETINVSVKPLQGQGPHPDGHLTFTGTGIGGAPLATPNVGGPTTITLLVTPRPCGAPTDPTGWWMCGKVKDTAGADLTGVVVELRDVNGVVKQTQTTGATTAAGWNYAFTNLTQGAKYFVSPVAGRNQVASPSNSSDTAPKDSMDFIFSGAVAKIAASGAPQTFVLITQTAYDPALQNPPAVGLAGGLPSFSAVIGSTGFANIIVPSNSPYFITCWKGNLRMKNPLNAGEINGGAPLPPSTPANPSCAAACPAL